ncbi:GNAT family N-acetyltransferase [Limnothrix sp. PR1529]|uniref:GNAT family N-acetyltransferase n=1 Tax=Limnothrix sp. PR1529 TaxID=1704291 RepID=UPI000C1606F0|nr:GNAT family N-acetyltransferase [Limnothrix sp. PR1529]
MVPEPRVNEPRADRSQVDPPRANDDRPESIVIRPGLPSDAAAIARLFHDTVREINSRDYSLSQVKAWAPDDLSFRNWAERSQTRWTIVAEDRSVPDRDLIAGFCELEPDGHIDCFYCHKNYQRCGLGRQLYQTLETEALDRSLQQLQVESSITARPFFEAMGFIMLSPQTVSVRGESFVNYKMVKALSPTPKGSIT